MKRYLNIIIILILISSAACSQKEEILPEGTHKVVVKEMMNSGGYSYLKVTEKDIEYWIAVPEMEVKEGDALYYTRSMEMQQFKSKTLDRTFESILFVEDISVSITKEEAAPADITHPEIKTEKAASVDIEPLSDGITVAQAYSKRESLNGQTVRIKGEVTKFNEKIMNKNWIHLQDGTGSSKNFDLMVTSQEYVKVGDIVIFEGVIAIDRDFGSGYFYTVILEKAKIIPEL